MGALKVELVGEEGALAIFLTVLGPLLIAGAAVIAALVARRTANERQAEQLAHDSERQREQLRHDSSRQERQLQHDREMRQKEHARGAVDSVIEEVQETLDTLIDLEFEAKKCEEKRRKAPSQSTADTSALRKSRKAFTGKMLEFHGAIARVMVRLGAVRDIPDKLGALFEAWDDLGKSLFTAIDTNRSDKELGEFEEKKEKAGAAFTELMIACERWLQFADAQTDSAKGSRRDERAVQTQSGQPHS
jgi:hypothetical protein